MEKHVDYIIVGLGIAGLTLCECLEARGKSYMVIDDPSYGATKIAGGVVNPMVLKRFTKAWRASEFLEEATTFYSELQQKIQVPFLKNLPVHRLFANAQEQNDWVVASDKEMLSSFISSEIEPNSNKSIEVPFGFGKVLQTFRIDTPVLLDHYRALLSKKQQLVATVFNYTQLEILDEEVRYGTIAAKKIVFAEGSQIVLNPFFNTTGIIPKKGEYITVKASGLNVDTILKGSYFVIPLGDDRYKIGATFAHGDITYQTTEPGRETLLQAFSKICKVPFEVIGQVAGMRPTVKDRRPILGSLQSEKIVFFNGLGSRGLMMAPLLANQLAAHLVEGSPISEEIDIKRFN